MYKRRKHFSDIFATPYNSFKEYQQVLKEYKERKIKVMEVDGKNKLVLGYRNEWLYDN